MRDRAGWVQAAGLGVDVEGDDGLKFTPVKPRHKEAAVSGVPTKP